MPEIEELLTPAQEAVARWEAETLAPVTDKRPERKRSFEGVSLVPVNRLYTGADVEEIAETLCQDGLDALPYHAGLDARVRQANQDRFLRDEGVIMVATIVGSFAIANNRYGSCTEFGNTGRYSCDKS